MLNFSAENQVVDVPFPVNGTWTDLLAGPETVDVHDFWRRGQVVNSNWGHVYFRAD